MPLNVDSPPFRISPEVAASAQRELRRRYRLANSAWIALGVIMVISGVSFYLDPVSVHESAIGHQLHGPSDELWNAAWGVGGLVLAVGVWRADRLVELVGQGLALIAVVMYTVAVFLVQGPRPGAFLCLAIACAGISRIAYLILIFRTGDHAVQLPIERRNADEGYAGPERRD